MKAIVLSGGEGTRLRPLSLLRPKPMVRLLDKPLLEHLLLLLKKHGFDEVCMTLQYLPQSITDYFGDGSEWSLSIRYQVEHTPLGTAGAVKACRDFIGKDPFLVISGDAACRLDLSAFARQHRESGADASILVRRSTAPLEYGLVLTDEGGSVRSFIEKPSGDRVYTDLVNTGIYFLQPSVLDKVPEGKACDFGAELFPQLLREGARLQAWEGSGYWNDVGNCEAYLHSCFDALDGTLGISTEQSRNIDCIPPCWVSPRASVAPDARIGPYAVIGEGSSVSSGCHVSHSVLDGAVLEQDCEVTGSILCQGAWLGRGCKVREGSVLADGVSLGAGTLVTSGVRIWPGKTLPGGQVITASITGRQHLYHPVFQEGSILRGQAGSELSPQLLMAMGSGRLSAASCGAASSGGAYASLLAAAFLTGCAAAGREAYLLETELPATAAWAAQAYGLDLCLFIRQEGERISIRFFDRDGLPAARRQQRELESAASGESSPALPGSCSELRQLSGLDDSHIAAACAAAGLNTGALKDMHLSVTGGKLLRKALTRLGAVLQPPADRLLSLRLSDDGLRLEAEDEGGAHWSHDRLLCALTWLELQDGGTLCLPYDAPETAQQLAREKGGSLLRLQRDGERALEVWRQKPWARDGLYLALRLCSHLLQAGLRLSELGELLPRYGTAEQSIRPGKPAPQLLKALYLRYPGETVSGLRLHTDKGCATVRSDGMGTLRIYAESFAAETAGELCTELRRELQQLDESPEGG